MAERGDIIENPVMGARIVFRETAADTDGELLRMEFFLEPGKVIAEEHLHPRQAERFEVLSGRLAGAVGGVPQAVADGDSSTIEAGVRHRWWNDGDAEAHLILEFRPALRTERFFETVFGLARDGKTSRGGVPRFWQMAVLLDEYREEFRPARLPRPVAVLMARVIAPIARLLGYRASYPEYAATGARPPRAAP